MRPLLLFAVAAATASCGGMDSPLPEVAFRGGAVMAHPALVPIFFADDPDVDALTRFSRWIVSSKWLATVGAEYGVGLGSVLGTVQRSDAAPSSITDRQIIDLVFAGLADGSLPKVPKGDLRSALYMLQLPQQTTVTAGSAMSCVDFGGYHASARRNGVEVAYAVIATCPGFVDGQSELEIRELVSSHELIEAATDPLPDNRPGFQIGDPISSWLALGGEVADLCLRGDPTATWNENGFVAQRSWSNTAAAAGHDPCVPGQQVPFFTAAATLTTVPRIPPGGQQDIELTGWSTGSKDPFSWPLSVSSDSPADVAFRFSNAALAPRAKSTLNVEIAASAPRGKLIRIYVFSEGDTSYQVLPMFAVVGDPCSSFTSCTSCSAQLGCGFCASTGACESIGNSSCSSSAFALSPGSCDGFCASHGATCASCAALPGCGWCDSSGGHCLEIARDGGGPAHASCAYADWNATPSYCSP
jgi:hypothetical protein